MCRISPQSSNAYASHACAKGHPSGPIRDKRRPQHRGEANATYRPVIRFATLDGRERHYESIVSRYPPRYSEGERIPILYDPAQPEMTRINDFPDLWLRPTFLAGVGSLLALLGAGSLRSREPEWRDYAPRSSRGPK